MRSVWAVLAIAAVALLSGCMHESGGPTVGVVDLDAVARQLGRSEGMAQEVKTNNEQLTAQLQASAAVMKQKVDESLKALQANPTAEARTAHQVLIGTSTRQLEAQKTALNHKANEKRQQVVLQFRQETRPAVEKVARAHGLSLVVTMSNHLLWFDKAADITSDVLAELGGPKTN
jgi:Skp family chaperone for outer membrane proteins